MNHKRGRPRNSRAGCKLCKPWKANGVRTETVKGERFSDHTRREAAEAQARMALIATDPEHNHDEFCVCAICIDQLDEPTPREEHEDLCCCPDCTGEVDPAIWPALMARLAEMKPVPEDDGPYAELMF